MAYGLIYTGTVLGLDDTTEVTVNIYDTTVIIDPGDTPETIALQLAENPVTITVIDNDKDKYSPIKAKQAKIQIYTASNVDIMTFTGGGDNRFYVEILTAEPQYIFKGFLITADLSQPYLSNPQLLTITASDCIGLLKDVKMTDFDEEVPTGKNRIAKYIAWCLSKTGLSLNINVVNNIRNGSGPTTIDIANFSNVSSTIFFPLTQYRQFFTGQRLQPSTGLNSATIFTVVTNNDGFNIQVTPAPVAQSGLTNFTLTDVDSGHIYDTCYLDAKTFEGEIGECEDCYRVLEKILGYDCYLTQYRGEWWIVRVDELDSNDIYVTIFDDHGDHVSDESPTSYLKQIGSTETLRFVQENQLLERAQILNFVKLTYNYNYPQEIPCNIDFSRGDLLTTVSATQKHYALDCWDKLWSNTSSDDPQTTGIYVRKLFNGDYETDRYLVLEANATRFTFVMSEEIPVQAKDKFILSLNKRLSTDIGGSGFFRNNCVQVRLYADDGTYYTHKFRNSADTEIKWYACNSTFRTFQKYAVFEGDVSADLNQAILLYDGESAEIPKDGYIKILLYRDDQFGDTVATYYDGLGFQYIPYINGSYNKFSGQYQKVTRTPDYTGQKFLSSNEDEVYISDAPKRLFKGALLFKVGSAYYLTKKFYPYNKYPSGDAPEDFVKPFGEHQIRAVFNQYRNASVLITGDVYGVGNSWPDLIHKYELTDPHPASNNRYFICTGTDQNFGASQLQQCILIECYDSTHPRVYTDDREFKYITT